MNLSVKEMSSGADVLAGRAGLKRKVRSPQIRKPDLSTRSSWKDLEGSVLHLVPGQLEHLAALTAPERRKLAAALMEMRPACLVVSGGVVPLELLAHADSANVAVLKSRQVPALRRLLLARLAPRTSMHGVLVEVFGIGMLIIGESAIGKSEAALDLVLRGHKLVADDLVIIERVEDTVTGRPTELGADLLQIRGLGIIDIKVLYGDTATAPSCEVGMVVELEEWRAGRHYSLLGLREQRYRLLGRNLPFLKLPIRPGRNMATLIEVAARNQMLKRRGVHTARDLDRKLARKLRS